MNRSSGGVALVLVLMVTAVLAITVLAMSLGAQSRVRQSAELLDRTEAMLNAHSHETAVAFSLLTESWLFDDVQYAERNSISPYSQSWNFRGTPFVIDNAQIRIQDESGLLQIPRPGQPVDELAALMRRLSFSDSQIRAALKNLAEQDPSSRVDSVGVIPVQDLSELFVGSLLVAPSLIESLAANTTFTPVSYFNPLAAPLEVLIVKYGETVGTHLYDLSSRRELDNVSFFKAVGELAEENTMLFPGPVFRVWVSVRGKGSIAGREVVWSLRPYESEPFLEWSSRRLGTSNLEESN